MATLAETGFPIFKFILGDLVPPAQVPQPLGLLERHLDFFSLKIWMWKIASSSTSVVPMYDKVTQDAKALQDWGDVDPDGEISDHQRSAGNSSPCCSFLRFSSTEVSWTLLY